MQGRLWRWLTLFLGVWTLIAFAFSGLLYFSNSQIGRSVGWKQVVLWQTIIYAWAILFLPILIFVRHFRYERRDWLRGILVHLPAAFLFVFLHSVIYTVVHKLIDGPSEPLRCAFFLAVWRLFISAWTLDFSMYGLILTSIFAYDFYSRFQAEQLKSSELKAALADSQLQALRMQLHPHFLFNTLNSISALIHEDVQAADLMVARLGDFLRLTLANSGEQEVTLGQEMDFLNRYLEIEGIRFQDRLSVETEIEPTTLAANVPNLILQPLIENAIRHGIAGQSMPGRITIRARRRINKLQMQVEDNGPGMPSGNDDGKACAEGIGLSNTRARLSHLYGSDYRVELSEATPHGLIVTMEIPFEIEEKAREKGN